MFWPLEKKPLHHQNSDMEPWKKHPPKSTKLVLQSDAKCIFQGLCQFLAVCFILFTLRLRILILWISHWEVDGRYTPRFCPGTLGIILRWYFGLEATPDMHRYVWLHMWTHIMPHCTWITMSCNSSHHSGEWLSFDTILWYLWAERNIQPPFAWMINTFSCAAGVLVNRQIFTNLS